VVGQLAVNLRQTQFGVMKVLQLHIGLSGLFAASIWHWVMWDLELFRDPRTKSSIRLTKNFWYPFIFIRSLCFGFGAFHVTGLFGYLYMAASLSNL
jgi:hypothetical protein